MTYHVFRMARQYDIRFNRQGDKLHVFPWDGVPEELQKLLREHRDSLLAAVDRGRDFGPCDCGDDLMAVPTWDGFCNLECQTCNRCLGCHPETDQAKALFGSDRELPTPTQPSKRGPAR